MTKHLRFKLLTLLMTMSTYMLGVGTPNTKANDWAGTYTVTSTLEMFGVGGCPKTFDMTIEYQEDWDNYVITSFYGNDVATLNSGGISFTPGENNTANIRTKIFLKNIVQGKQYYKMFDINGGTEPLAVTVNPDGSLSISDFSVYNMTFGDNWTENLTLLAKHTNVKAVKHVTETPPEEMQPIPGDVNNDGIVTIGDVVYMVNYILQNPSAEFNSDLADINNDGEITMADVVGVVSIVLNGSHSK